MSLPYFAIGAELALRGVYNDPPTDLTRAAEQAAPTSNRERRTRDEIEDAKLLHEFKMAVRP